MTDSENAQLRRCVAALVDACADASDRWRGGDHWQSDTLQAAIWAGEEVLGLPHDSKYAPPGARDILLEKGATHAD